MKSVLLSAVLFLLILSSCKEEEPVACFNYNVNGFEVNFTNCSKNADEFLWEFGDQATAIAVEPDYTYAVTGDYQVSLRASSKDGSNTITKTVQITGCQSCKCEIELFSFPAWQTESECFNFNFELEAWRDTFIMKCRSGKYDCNPPA